MTIMAISSKDIETLWGRYQSEGVSKLMKKTALKKYYQTENPDNPETPVNTGALVYCHRDWMLTSLHHIGVFL